MPLDQWIAIGMGILLVAFILFTFRQGMAVRPDDRPDRGDGAGMDGNHH